MTLATRPHTVEGTVKSARAAARQRNDRAALKQIAGILATTDTITEVHLDIRWEADSARFPVFLLDFALILDYIEPRDAPGNAFFASVLLALPPTIQLSLPSGTSLELTKYMLGLAERLGEPFQAAANSVRLQPDLVRLLERLPAARELASNQAVLTQADAALRKLSEALQSVGSDSTTILDDVAWERLQLVLEFLQERATPMHEVAGGTIEIDLEVYSRALASLSRIPTRQKRRYNNRADALNFATACQLNVNAERNLQELSKLSPYFLMLTPDRKVREELSAHTSQILKIDRPILRTADYGAYRQMISALPGASSQPEDVTWELLLAAKDDLSQIAGDPSSDDMKQWSRSASPDLLSTASQVWSMARLAGERSLTQLESPKPKRGQRRSVARQELEETLARFVASLKRFAPSSADIVILERELLAPRPTKWRRSSDRSNLLILEVDDEPIAECLVFPAHISMSLRLRTGFERFVDRINRILEGQSPEAPRIKKFFEGVDIETHLDLFEYELRDLPPPWSADDIWAAANGKFPLLVRMNTQWLDAWYEVQLSPLQARCGILTHLELYYELSDLVRECGGKRFAPGECMAQVELAIEEIRGGPGLVSGERKNTSTKRGSTGSGQVAP